MRQELRQSRDLGPEGRGLSQGALTGSLRKRGFLSGGESRFCFFCREIGLGPRKTDRLEEKEWRQEEQ